MPPIDPQERRLLPADCEIEVVVVTVVGRVRDRIASKFDGRFLALDPADLAPLIDALVGRADLAGVDAVLGIPEGGTVPAHAFAVRAGLRLAMATERSFDLGDAIEFEVDHAEPGYGTKRILGLAAGDRVIVVEDQVVTGRTVLSCIAALRAAGVRCTQVATLLATDDSGTRARLAAAGIGMHAACLMPLEAGELLYRRSGHGARRPQMIAPRMDGGAGLELISRDAHPVPGE